MLNFSATGTVSVADAIAAARDVPASVIPYAASTALTRSVKAGQLAVQQRMPQVFDQPTAYTLNALRVEPATKDKLTARIAVKDQAGGKSTRPESYLLPEVQGGARAEKRFERALRYAGVLSQGWSAILGRDAPLDAHGNLIPSVLRMAIAAAKRGDKPSPGGYFVGGVDNSKRSKRRKNAQPGIYQQTSKGVVLPILIFTPTKPVFRQRLDFEDVVAPVVRDRFAVEFSRAATAILAKRR